jgi:hypothetical protein
MFGSFITLFIHLQIYFKIIVTMYSCIRFLNNDKKKKNKREKKLMETGWWFSLGTTVSSTNKTYRYDITEILLKVVINTINQPMFFFIQRQTIIFT